MHGALKSVPFPPHRLSRTGFAASTGWRMNSDYAPMPAYLAEYMQDFFAVQNTLLFDLIGRNFTNEW
jgi:hypothetical protein